MTKEEHLLTILSEECAEVAHRASKALRFGLHEIQNDHTLTNAERLRDEFADLVEAYSMLVENGMVRSISQDQLSQKREKVLRYLEYSAVCGTLTT